jgi:acid phosphatase (class A)
MKIRNLSPQISAVVISLYLAGGVGSPAAVANNFIHEDQIDLVKLLSPPPAIGSAEDDKDRRILREEQQKRTKAAEEKAEALDHFTVFDFAEVVGPGFSRQNLPITDGFFKRVGADQRFFVDAAKKAFGRLHPAFVDPSLTPSLHYSTTGSYPSGHTTEAALVAMVLAEIFPEKREAILRRGAEISYQTVIGGVTYPSDYRAGQLAGEIIATTMMRSPDFIRDLAAAQAEARAAVE